MPGDWESCPRGLDDSHRIKKDPSRGKEAQPLPGWDWIVDMLSAGVSHTLQRKIKQALTICEATRKSGSRHRGRSQGRRATAFVSRRQTP